MSSEQTRGQDNQKNHHWSKVLFDSFFMGGFECATHRRRDGRRVDVIAATRHDLHCAPDFLALQRAGIYTVRDGLRWHLIEATPGVYDWSSFLPMLRAAHDTGTQVLWDLCHWGLPDWLDVFSEEFISRFAAFSTAAATLIRSERAQAGQTGRPFYSPINEISFWSWAGGDVRYLHPFAEHRGPELKQQLVLASIAGIRAVRAVDPGACFVQPEPLINITTDPRDPTRDPAADFAAAQHHSSAQFQAWDMITGHSQSELGGSPDLLDVIGVNVYWNNQWIHEGAHAPLGHPQHRPLHAMLHELWQRYRKPVLLTETGAEANSAVGWLGYVSAEVRQAQRMGVPVLGICLYPVMDYPGWDDERHCPCGLLHTSADWSERHLRADLLYELQTQQRLFEPATRYSV